jgi:hypothetical protein
MRVLVACEFSGTVRQAFRDLGHDAWSCDLLPCTDASPYHYECNVLAIIDEDWDLMIAHPPCTYLASAGLHYNNKVKGREAKTEAALSFVRRLLDATIPKIALENPIGCISTRIRPPHQIIQPWQFGHPEQKQTCLWLKGLPLLKPTEIVKGREIGFQHLPPSKYRAMLRSITYKGIALAMADQWGKLPVTDQPMRIGQVHRRN